MQPSSGQSSSGSDGRPDAPRGVEARTPAERRGRIVGIALMCGALLCFTVLDAVAKWLIRDGVPALQVVWFRYAGALLMSLLAAPPGLWRGALATKRPGLQLGRSLLLLGATVGNFVALQTLQLAETNAIAFAMPLIVALIAGPMLGEWVGPRRLAAICVGFVGVLVVTQPGAAGFKPAMLISLGGTLCYALYNIATRVLAPIDAPRTTLLYSNVFGAVAFAPLMPFVWVAPSGAGQMALFALAALMGAFGHWLLIQAHRRAPAAVLAPFIYAQIVFMIAAGYLLFDDRPGVATLIGASIVIASGLYLLALERAVRRA